MRKLVCFLSAICLVILMSITASAKDLDVSLSVRTTDSDSVVADVILGSEASVCGGEFLLSFDEDSVDCSGVESEKFDIETYKDDGKIRIALANDDCVKLRKNESVFSLKFKPQSKKNFDVQLESDCVIGQNLEKVALKHNSTKITVDVSDCDEYSRTSKEKPTSRNVEKDKSKITKKSNGANESDRKSSFLPIKVNGKGSGNGIAIAVCVLVVTAFLFGMGFRKYMISKQEDNNDTIKIEK